MWPSSVAFLSYLLHCLLYDFLLLLTVGAGPLCMSALLVQREGSSPQLHGAVVAAIS